MADRYVDYVRLDAVVYADRNAKEHDEAGIRRAIEHFGFGEIPLRDERTGRLVAGHGRHAQLVALHAGGGTPPDGVRIDPADGMWLMPLLGGWSSRSDPDAEAYGIASNHLGEKGGWDERVRAEILEELAEQQLLDVTGHDQADLDAILAALAEAGSPPGEHGAPGEGEDEPLGKGDALTLVGVTVGDPDIATSRGQVWQLDRHHLVVADVHADWALFVPLLAEGTLLWPYPSLLAPFVDKAEQHPVVMVQPNTYLAGWLLVKWARITGEQPVLVDS